MTADLETFNLADIWEAVSDRVADRTAVVCGSQQRTYAELEARANRLAHWMLDQGVRPGQHVALYLVGGIEYFEAMLAAYKIRAVPINVNFRYVEQELRHLFDDADAVGVVFHRQFAPRVEAIRGDLPQVRWWLAADDPSYEDALGASSPERDFAPRSGDDPYVIYTGGTTGFPKGVVWRSEDAFYACIGGGDPMRLFGAVDEPAAVLERIIDGTFVFLPVAPLMHAAGQWTSLSWLFSGGQVVLLPGGPLDAGAVWRTIEEQQVNLITVVGDAVVRPLVDAWDAEGPFDVSTLLSIGSGGAPLTPSLKARLMAIVPNCAVVDGFGSSETGAQGSQRLEAGAQPTGAVAFKPYGETTTVLDELTREEVVPGSGVVGRVALRGRIPQGYYNDPDKTAETFVEAGGHRWVLTGDMATVDADGTIALLGRGSVCINTGGEKVFPEEVEAVLKGHADVYDAVVVGLSDDRWGQRVTAVVQPAEGRTPSLEEIATFCRSRLAGYKVPRALVLVDEVVRSPAGKADYRWAKDVAEREAVSG